MSDLPTVHFDAREVEKLRAGYAARAQPWGSTVAMPSTDYVPESRLLEARAALAAANARAEDAEARADIGDRDCEGLAQRNDALRADLARVTGERDGWQRAAESQNKQWSKKCTEATEERARAEKAEADLATARAEAEALKTRLHDANNALFVASAKKSMAEKSVRELVAGLRECRMHAVGYAPESLVAKIDALLAKHAAPAPPPAAVPGLAFGPMTNAGVRFAATLAPATYSLKRMHDGSWCWTCPEGEYGYAPTDAEAIAAANAHNAARLARQGTP